MNTGEKELYLTFDDGPHPAATPFVLDQLDKFEAKATFFCVGENVLKYQHIYQDILKRGHTVGNHTHHHLNGWKVSLNQYLNDIQEASDYISTHLFRPPYGRITNKAGKELLKNKYNVIMWDVLSGDFDVNIIPEKCCANVIRNATKGSIIVFHDSQKAFKNMTYALPKVLEYFSKQGFVFKCLRNN